jgi:hypothetical protein
VGIKLIKNYFPVFILTALTFSKDEFYLLHFKLAKRRVLSFIFPKGILPIVWLDFSKKDYSADQIRQIFLLSGKLSNEISCFNENFQPLSIVAISW